MDSTALSIILVAVIAAIPPTFATYLNYRAIVDNRHRIEGLSEQTTIAMDGITIQLAEATTNAANARGQIAERERGDVRQAEAVAAAVASPPIVGEQPNGGALAKQVSVAVAEAVQEVQVVGELAMTPKPAARRRAPRKP